MTMTDFMLDDDMLDDDDFMLDDDWFHDTRNGKDTASWL